MAQEFKDLYYLVDGKKCPHVFVGRSGKEICERVEGHDGQHAWVPTHIKVGKPNVVFVDLGTF